MTRRCGRYSGATGSKTAEEIVQPVISSTGSPAPRSVRNSRGLLRVRIGQLGTRERVGDDAVRLAVGQQPDVAPGDLDAVGLVDDGALPAVHAVALRVDRGEAHAVD